MDANVCTCYLYYLIHKFPEQTVIMALNLYKILQHRASLVSTTVKDGFIPPQGRPVCCMSHVPQPIHRQQWLYTGSVQRLLRSLLLVSIKEQSSNKFILFNISPGSTKTVFFVKCQELRNW